MENGLVSILLLIGLQLSLVRLQPVELDTLPLWLTPI